MSILLLVISALTHPTPVELDLRPAFSYENISVESGNYLKRKPSRPKPKCKNKKSKKCKAQKNFDEKAYQVCLDERAAAIARFEIIDETYRNCLGNVIYSTPEEYYAGRDRCNMEFSSAQAANPIPDCSKFKTDTKGKRKRR